MSSPKNSSSARRLEWLPEPEYFDTTTLDLMLAADLTITTVAQWATRYQSWPVGHGPSFTLSGKMPKMRSERGAFLRRVVDSVRSWISETSELPVQVGLILTREASLILDQHDGPPPRRLVLSRIEFATLQTVWSEHALPLDLYFASSEKHRRVSKRELYGGVVLVREDLSPRQLAQRRDASVTGLAVQDDKKRRDAFIDDCRTFRRALNRRLVELTEPGSEPASAELDHLALLKANVTVAELRTRGIDVSGIEPGVPRRMRSSDDLSH